MPTITLNLPKELLDEIEKEASKFRISRSEAARRILKVHQAVDDMEKESIEKPQEPEGPKSDFIDEELAGDSEQADEE